MPHKLVTVWVGTFSCSAHYCSPVPHSHNVPSYMTAPTHLLLRVVGSVITKRGDTENLGQSCDRQSTQGSYSGLSPLPPQSSTVRKRRDHEVHLTTDSLMYTHPHPYLVALNRGEGRRPQYTRDSVQGIEHKWISGTWGRSRTK